MSAPCFTYTRATCPVCERDIRTLNDGTIGPHTTGRPDPTGERRSPRCPGWGRKPKDTT